MTFPPLHPESLARKLLRRLGGGIARVHHDERGVISVLSVFAIFLFTILMVLIINVGRQIDDKIKMQNAADAAAQSGGTILARGMNVIAFSNHLLCETFALTAYMREGRDRNSDPLIPPILAQWKRTGQNFQNAGAASGFTKFENLGKGIVEKVPLEQSMVDTFSEMTYYQSKITLPLFEWILAGPDGQPSTGKGSPAKASPLGGYIPRFQRAVIQITPQIASTAADEISGNYGKGSQSLHQNIPLHGLMWRMQSASQVAIVGQTDESNPYTRTLPVIDPSPAGPDYGVPQQQCYFCIASHHRQRLAKFYLEYWISDWQGPYFSFADIPNQANLSGMQSAKMSNYINLYRIFACQQLTNLLHDEYPNSNLPHVLREIRQPMLDAISPDCMDQCTADSQAEYALLERDYNFVAVSYWPHLSPMFPGLFKNPLKRDSQQYALTFAQTTLFIPRARHACCPWAWPSTVIDPTTGQPTVVWTNHYDNWPGNWDLFNENWMSKIVPTTAAAVPTILQQNPGVVQGQPPNLGNADWRMLKTINTH